MIQLIALRPQSGTAPGKKAKNFHRFTRPKIVAKNLADLFENIESYLAKLPADERWNIFYTVADCHPDKIRDFQKQEILAFDVDGVDHTRALDYVPVVASVLGIPDDQLTVVNSGNGLHFLVQLASPLKKTDISELQPHYKEIIEKMGRGLEEKNLPGKFDMIFDTGRILRVPFSINKKFKNGEWVTKQSSTLQVDFTAHTLDLKKLSGLPDVQPDDHIPEPEFRMMFGVTDDDAIMSGCEFLKWVVESPREVREPQGYAALSILARMKGGGAAGRELAKSIAKTWTDSSSIRQWDLDEKIDKALQASGPRTCKNINLISDKCKTCPYNGEVKSPIGIVGPDFIRTESTGFYTVLIGGNGSVQRIPNYDDLLKAFEKEFKYFFQPQGKIVWGYTGTHYREITESEIKAFAEQKFDPAPKENMRQEFLAKVRANNLRTSEECQDFWASSTGLVNLKNGVLDLKTKELKPHSEEYGFRYVLPYEYQPTARAPRFEQFLDEITLGKKHFRDVILDAMGAVLLPGYSQHNAGFWWFQGTGWNGKSALLNTLRELYGGTHNVITMDAPSLEGDAGRFRMADLDGKLLCILEEVNEKKLGSRLLGVLKNITAGGFVQVERKGRDPYQMVSTAKFIMTANAAPVLEDTSDAIARRMIPVPFRLNLMDEKCPVKHDPALEFKLKAELPGIFVLALQSAHRLLERHHLLNPKESREIFEEIRRSSDSVRDWAMDNLDATGCMDHKVPAKELYDAYVSSGVDYPVSTQSFGRRLRDMYGEKVNSRNGRLGSQVIKFWHGLRLKNASGAAARGPDSDAPSGADQLTF